MLERTLLCGAAMLFAGAVALADQPTAIAADLTGDIYEDLVLIDPSGPSVRGVAFTSGGMDPFDDIDFPVHGPGGIGEVFGATPPRFAAYDRAENELYVYEADGKFVLIGSDDGFTGAGGAPHAPAGGAFPGFVTVTSPAFSTAQSFDATGGSITAMDYTNIGSTGFVHRDATMGTYGNAPDGDLVSLYLNQYTGAGHVVFWQQGNPATEPWVYVADRGGLAPATRITNLTNRPANFATFACWTPGSDDFQIVSPNSSYILTIQNYAAKRPIVDLRAPDLDSDGAADVAILLEGGLAISTYLRSGVTLTHAQSSEVALKFPAREIVPGDFAGDGYDSLITISDVVPPTRAPASILVGLLHTDGSGLFSTTPDKELGLPAFGTGPADTSDPNVVFYEGTMDGTEPEPRVAAAHKIPGFTTKHGGYDGVSVDVEAAQTDPDLGFFDVYPTETVNQTLPGAAGDYTVGLNRIGKRQSAFYFGDAGLYDELGVIIDPPAGTYETPFEATFLPETGPTIFYAIDGGDWGRWNGETIPILKSTTVEYVGTSGGVVGPTKLAEYVLNVPGCLDSDGDGIPDLIEVQLGMNPFLPADDENANGIMDLAEFLRGADTILPEVPAPLLADADGDGWGDYDEGLRGTLPGNSSDYPVAPNLFTPEALVQGAILDLSALGDPPAGTPAPGKPYPSSYNVTALTPSGAPIGGESAGGTSYATRVSGEHFHIVRARANDASGRLLMRVEPPTSLCIDPGDFCRYADDADAWRTAYRSDYEAVTFSILNGHDIEPQSTVVAYLLNRYYEVQSPMVGEEFAPGIDGAGPPPELVDALRTTRNEAELFVDLEFGVTAEMVELVADYHKFATSPLPRPTPVVLADLFAGRSVAPEEVPDGVRLDNIPVVAAQVALLMDGLGDGTTDLTGTIQYDEFGFYLETTGTYTTIRLSGLAESFIPGTTVTLRAILDVDDCDPSVPTARVVGVLNREVPPVPPSLDSDHDGLPDEWEYYYFGNLDQDGNDNPDGDNSDNAKEYADGTNPTVRDGDLDGDGVLDICESFSPPVVPEPGQTNAMLADTDSDGLDDLDENVTGCPGFEGIYPTDPRDFDSDDDFYGDGIEVLMLGSDPMDPSSPAEAFSDLDGDRLPDSIDPDPTSPDSDGDGFSDYAEELGGSDALDPDSIPSPPPGDADGNGTTNMSDAFWLARLISGMEPQDVNGDGIVDEKDAELIYLWSIGDASVPYLPYFD
ncbi:hypothetical protein KQI84_17510 [bacterium]|nr:hypothetical protein [bacterium]